MKSMTAYVVSDREDSKSFLKLKNEYDIFVPLESQHFAEIVNLTIRSVEHEHTNMTWINLGFQQLPNLERLRIEHDGSVTVWDVTLRIHDPAQFAPKLKFLAIGLQKLRCRPAELAAFGGLSHLHFLSLNVADFATPEDRQLLDRMPLLTVKSATVPWQSTVPASGPERMYVDSPARALLKVMRLLSELTLEDHPYTAETASVLNASAPRLARLVVRRNRLDWDRPTLNHFTALESLEFAELCNTTSLPMIQPPPPKLAKLVLRDCEKLRSVGDAICAAALTSLEILRCPAVDFDRAPDSAERASRCCDTLRVLKIAACGLTAPPPLFGSNNQHVTIVLVNCKLAAFPMHALRFPHLATLCLSGNPLERLEFAPQSAPALHTLELANTNVSKLAALPPSVVKLDLTHSQTRVVEPFLVSPGLLTLLVEFTPLSNRQIQLLQARRVACRDFRWFRDDTTEEDVLADLAVRRDGHGRLAKCDLCHVRRVLNKILSCAHTCCHDCIKASRMCGGGCPVCHGCLYTPPLAKRRRTEE